MNVAGMKLETWLRIAKLPYKAVIATAQDYAVSPKRKIPFIDYKGRFVGDFTLIIDQEVLSNHLFAETPPEESELFVKGLREMFFSQMYAHGIGRHSNEEIVQIICADFQALSDFLADKPFFMGDQPTTLDATAYAYVGNFN